MPMVAENVERLPDEVMLFDEDNLYFDEHMDELARDFPEEWIAIYHQRVVGHDSSLDRLMDGLVQKNLPVGQIAVRRATRDQLLFL